jgi:hypothetical protein
MSLKTCTTTKNMVSTCRKLKPPNTMDWSALPYELEETILGFLSLRQLADVSTTCKRFEHLFRHMLAKEQKSRCDLAIAQFGKARLACIADLAHSFLNAQRFHPHSRERLRWECTVSEDGTLHVVQANRSDPTYIKRTVCRWTVCEDGMVHVEEEVDVADVQCKAGVVNVLMVLSWCSNMLSFHVLSHDGSRVAMLFSGEHLWTCFRIEPRDGEDLGGVALVQAFLSGDFAPILGEGRPLTEVRIKWGSCNQGFTSAGLEAQIGPLLPLAKSYSVTDPEWVGWKMVRERPGEGQMATSAKRMITLHATQKM